MLSAFALLLAATSRVAMLAYTMPIWAALFAWLALGERFTTARILALILCGTGMAILIYPLCQSGIPAGLLLAVAHRRHLGGRHRLSEMGAHQRRSGHHRGVAAGRGARLRRRVPAVGRGLAAFDAGERLALFGTVFTGLVGSGLAYFLWFKIVGSLPAMTASLGILSAPVIGVISTAIILGERPTVPDIIGFVLIFAASACVVLPTRS